MILEVAGISVEVLKKKIKNLHLAVLPPDGAVRVSEPETFPDAAITMFVRTRLGWIRKQRETFEQQPRQSIRRYVSGESFYLWGRQYFLSVRYGNRGNSLTLSGDRAILTVRRTSTVKQRESFVREWYRSFLKTEIEKRLPFWERKTELFCSSWQTKYMTTLWGTCNTKTGKVWLNLQLAKKPLECLDYVILHELTHLKYRRHDDCYIAFLDAHMPYWREKRKTLNESTLDHLPMKL